MPTAERIDIIKRLEKDFSWLFKGRFSKANIELTFQDGEKNKPKLSFDGIWEKGEFQGDQFNGTFKGGKFNGEIFGPGATFEYGTFLKGMFLTSVWENGNWKGGNWEFSSIWKKGETFDGVQFVVSDDPPWENINESTNEFNELIGIDNLFSLDESFSYGSLTTQEQDELFSNFEKAYKKAVGAAWSKSQFESRAYGWTFFGSIEGGIAVRKQNSGMYKLNGSYGSPKSVINGFNKMMSEIGKEPIWGVMTLNLVKLLEKVSNGEFRQPPKLFVRTVIPHIKKIFGTEIKDIRKDGAIIVDTPAGEMEKYLVANKVYFRTLLDNAQKYPDKVPVPAPVLKVLIGLLKKFI